MNKKPALLLLAAVAALLAALPLLAAGDDHLFVDLSGTLNVEDAAVSQARYVAINWQALQGSEIRLHLFQDQVLTARRQRLDPSSSAGDFIWAGHVAGLPGSTVTLSVVRGVMAGSIAWAGYEQYRVVYDGRRHILQALDHAATIEVEGPDTLLPPPAPRPPANFEPAQGPLATPDANPGCEDGSQIDLLVAYTAQVMAAQGGPAAMEALINQRVAAMNSANHNSGLPFRYRLAQVMRVDYVESGDVRLDLPRLRDPADGYLDEVPAARDVYRADLVSLLVHEASVGLTCGVGYQLNELSLDFAPSAYNVAALEYAGPLYTCSPLTMAHEFGHNMGGRHQREIAGGEPVLPFAYGFQSPQNTFRTIMAYNCEGGCPRINYWSNPDVHFNGEATGRDHEQDPANSADNAQAMLETARYVANFRPNCPAVPTATPGATATAGPIGRTPTPNPTAQAQPPGPFRAFVPLTWN